ncbi:unnamed protein product [Dicrocoelium dendriticum]|nr:unnamed protein product [Dicrocoelium dendriticum]
MVSSFAASRNLEQLADLSSDLLLLLSTCALKAKRKDICESVAQAYEELFNVVDENLVIHHLLLMEILLLETDGECNQSLIWLSRLAKCVTKSLKISKDIKANHLVPIICNMFYKGIREYTSSSRKVALIPYLRTVVQLLSEFDDQPYRWLILFVVHLFDAYMLSGQRKEAIQLFDAAIGGPARRVPDYMVRLLAKASAANVASAERTIAWALGVHGGSLPDSTKKSLSGVSRSVMNLKMKGKVSQTLVTLGLSPLCKFAKLCNSNFEFSVKFSEVVPRS